MLFRVCCEKLTVRTDFEDQTLISASLNSKSRFDITTKRLKDRKVVVATSEWQFFISVIGSEGLQAKAIGGWCLIVLSPCGRPGSTRF
jgi:hypothetical protein